MARPCMYIGASGGVIAAISAVTAVVCGVLVVMGVSIAGGIYATSKKHYDNAIPVNCSLGNGTVDISGGRYSYYYATIDGNYTRLDNGHTGTGRLRRQFSGTAGARQYITKYANTQHTSTPGRVRCWTDTESPQVIKLKRTDYDVASDKLGLIITSSILGGCCVVAAVITCVCGGVCGVATYVDWYIHDHRPSHSQTFSRPQASSHTQPGAILSDFEAAEIVVAAEVAQVPVSAEVAQVSVSAEAVEVPVSTVAVEVAEVSVANHTSYTVPAYEFYASSARPPVPSPFALRTPSTTPTTPISLTTQTASKGPSSRPKAPPPPARR